MGTLCAVAGAGRLGDRRRRATSLKNYYGAAVTEQATGLQVITCPIDALALGGPVRVIKVDAEGHDAIVLRGARRLIEIARGP
jgi:hypothetical protein